MLQRRFSPPLSARYWSIQGMTREILLLKAMFDSVKLGDDLAAVQEHFEEIRETLRSIL